MKTLVLGLGNPILRDDSAGLRVAQKVREKLGDREATVIETSLFGPNLLDLLVGYDKAIIVDSIKTAGGKAGEVYRLREEDFSPQPEAAGIHLVDPFTAMKIGKRWGLSLPREIVIIAIEAADVTTFSEECTPEVEQALPRAVEMVLRELRRKSPAD